METTVVMERTEIHREGSLRLYRYAGERSLGVSPVVLVYSFINKPTVLDLLPGRSVVESLLAAGHDVFLVDWGQPRRAESRLDLAGHVARLERAVAKATATVQRDKAQVLGYCLGGTMALVLGMTSLALVERIALLATPVVFEKGGTLALWAQTPTLEPGRLAITPDGNVPGEALREMFRWLDPLGQIKKWSMLAERASDPDFLESFLAQERWANDCVDFPAVVFDELLTKLYREDRLARGELVVQGKRLGLETLTQPILNVIAPGDKIVPEEASLPLETLAPRVKTLKVSGGHIGMTVGRKAPATTHKQLAAFFAGEESR